VYGVKAVIKDRNGTTINEFKGVYNKGAFVYKTGGFIFGLGAEEHRIQCDVELGEKISGEIVVAFKFEGDRYTQIPVSIGRVNTKTSWVADCILHFKNAELQKNLVLQQAKGNEEIMKWLAIFALGVMVLASYFMMSNTYNQATIYFTKLNTTVSECPLALAYEHNNSASFMTTLHTLNAYLAAHTPT
jgi:hypothetical protein